MTVTSLWIIDESGLEVNAGEVFVLGIQAGTFFGDSRYLVNAVKSNDLQPFGRVATFDHPLDNDGRQLRELYFFPVVFPEQMTPDGRTVLLRKHDFFYKDKQFSLVQVA